MSESFNSPHTSAGFPAFVPPPPQTKTSSFKIKYALLHDRFRRGSKALSVALAVIIVIVGIIVTLFVKLSIAGVPWQVYAPGMFAASVSIGLSVVLSIGDERK